MCAAALAVVLLAGHAFAAKPAAPRLDELLAEFKRSPGLFARFHEEKHLAMLDAPLVTEGTIHFSPPGRLARRAERPVASTLLIDGDKLRFGDADGAQSMDLATNPVARLFVDSFVTLLAGDRAGLERIFKVALAARPGGGWVLTLVPRVAPMDKVIKDMSLRGDGLALREMDVRETSGDWTHTSFTDVDVNRRYTPAELARIFRLPGK
jgi:outer membrane lipoprotein carrier protein LolA